MKIRMDRLKLNADAYRRLGTALREENHPMADTVIREAMHMYRALGDDARAEECHVLVGDNTDDDDRARSKVIIDLEYDRFRDIELSDEKVRSEGGGVVDKLYEAGIREMQRIVLDQIENP